LRLLALAVVAATLTGCGGSTHSGGTAKPPVQASSKPAANPLAVRQAPAGDATAAAILAYLNDQAAHHKFAGSATVVRRGEVLARFGAGDSGNHTVNTPDTVYRIASVSKQFTAMIVLKLADQGLLRLDDPVCRYLVPDYVAACPKAWAPITIRQVLVHTSGIPDISGFPDFFAKLATPTTTKQLIARFANKPLTFAPGKGWTYSNSGYILAGAIIEKLTHKSYGQVLGEQITSPLGLTDTGYSDRQPPAGFAKGFFSPGRPAGPIDGSEAAAAGGVYTTVDDLARWDRGLGAHLVAPAATVQESFTAQARCPSGGCVGDPSTGYAFGWLVDTLNGHRMLYHPGDLQGYHANNTYLPDDDIEVVVLSNVESTDVNGVARHLATMALGSA
jgi:CubicO group peptidase (beta-lactamase class C family)